MRSAGSTVRLMAAVALLLFVQAAAALWRTLPELRDTGRALYHSVTGLCSHTVRVNWEDVVAGVAVAVLMGVVIVGVRFSCYVLGRWHSTCQQVRQLLTARVAEHPVVVVELARRLGVADRLDVVRSVHPFAFTHGALHPRICTSTTLVDLLSTEELEAVFLHEDCHRQRRDPLMVLVTGGLAHALFFIPVLRDLQARYDAAKEFAADAAAVQCQGGPERMAGALYKILSYHHGTLDLRGAAVGGLSVTEQRIDHLLAPGESGGPALPGVRVAVSVLTFGAVTLPLLVLAAVNVAPITHMCRL